MKKNLKIPKLNSIKEKTVNFNSIVKIIKTKSNKNSHSNEKLKDKPSKKLEKKVKKFKNNKNNTSFVNTLTIKIPLIARQTQYLRKRIF
jgi:hypothetical protein